MKRIEIDIGRYLIYQSKKDCNDNIFMTVRETNIFQRILKEFIKNSTKAKQKNGGHDICLALAILRSPVLEMIYRHSENNEIIFDIPDILIDEIHLSQNISNDINLLRIAEMYQVDIFSFRYLDISINKIFDYVLESNCNDINFPGMKRLKRLIELWCFCYELFGNWVLNSDEYKELLTHDIKKIYKICKKNIIKESNFSLLDIKSVFYISDFIYADIINKRFFYFKKESDEEFKSFKRILKKFATNDYILI